MMNKSKKFRFDSFATEFSEDKQDIPDNDSGIGESFFSCLHTIKLFSLVRLLDLKYSMNHTFWDFIA